MQAKLAFERLKIEHVYHPFIAGANASKITEQTGARINIPPPSAQKDEITIAGEKEGVAKAKETVMAIYDEKKRKTTTVSIEVKKSQHKYVIGPRGETLKEILTLTGKNISKQTLTISSAEFNHYCLYMYLWMKASKHEHSKYFSNVCCVGKQNPN